MRTTRPRLQAPIVLLGLAVALATATGGSQATAKIVKHKTTTAGGIKYRVQVAKHSQRYKAGGVYCPKGTHQIGGGVAVQGGGRYVAESFPGQGGFWSYGVTNPNEHSYKVKTSVICDESKPKRRDASVNVGPGLEKLAAVQCPSGYHVYSGGLLGQSLRYTRLTGSFPYDSSDADDKPDDGWAASAENLHPTQSIFIVVAALCGKRMPNYKAASETVGPDSNERVPIHCGGQKPFVYGGGSATDAGLHLQNFWHLSLDLSGGAPDPRNWSAGVRNLDDGASSFQAFAYATCGKPLH